jgi:hypothetical protein
MVDDDDLVVGFFWFDIRVAKRERVVGRNRN